MLKIPAKSLAVLTMKVKCLVEKQHYTTGLVMKHIIKVIFDLKKILTKSLSSQIQ